MKIVVFGLSISSSWGNGHATLLRGLFRALYRRGHEIHFFEKDVPYYAEHRDAISFPYVHLHLYATWEDISDLAQRELHRAEVGVITSYCPDAIPAAELLLSSDRWRNVFYDMDTPVTFARLDRGESVPYIPPGGFADFDLVLSYTGGVALNRLRNDLGAPVTTALYGWVDPDEYSPAAPETAFKSDLSYLGTYSHDRQHTLENLLISPASTLPSKQFVIAGAMYPDCSGWPSNIKHFEHIPPSQHRAFYSSSSVTLNITRGSMARMGYCPSGRMFEATACGAALISDEWEGLELFFEPGSEIIVVRNTDDVIRVLRKPGAGLGEIARRGRERTLDCHTAAIRAQQFIRMLESTDSIPSRNRKGAVFTNPLAMGRAL